jgi:hypothetical protein
MAQTSKETTAILNVIANCKTKFAELDALDDEFAELDATMPEGEPSEQFDLLSDKREELEQEIRSMRERVQLISEWEKFKGSGWSEEVQAELNALDQQFSAISDGASTDMSTPALPALPPVPEAPEAPLSPEFPAGITTEPEALANEPLPSEASNALPAEPLAAPTASSKNAKINEKTNYQSLDKKSTITSSQKGDTHMANTTKPSLKEKLAEVKSKREAISKEAKSRVASAWTIAKTMLPTAPATIQKSFAASLLNNSTKVLTAALRQTAINAHNTKLAETFKEVHKVELNDLLEDPSILNAEKNSVKSELKGDAKNAGKVADDRKDAGPQTGTYDDGRKGSEPKELDASKASERPDAGEKPGQTQNLSDGKTAACSCEKGGKPCVSCKNKDKAKDKADKAKAKKADGEEVEEVPTAATPEEVVPEEGIETPEEMPQAIAENPEAEAAEILTDEKQDVLGEKIDEALGAIKSLETELEAEKSEENIGLEELGEGELEPEGEEVNLENELEDEGLEDGSEELDFSKVFDSGAMEEKAASLANEGEDKQAAEEDDFFAPSSAGSLEASMDDDGMSDMHDMFSLQGSDGDPLASLIAGLKTAEQIAGLDVLPSSTGEAADHFEQAETSAEDRDNESDHSGNLFFEALDSITPEEQGAKRTKQDAIPELQVPKAATLKKIHTATGSDKPVRFDIGSALFGSDE